MDSDPLNWCEDNLTSKPLHITHLPIRRHTFSHFHFDMIPVEILLNNPNNRVMDDGAWVWYKLANPDVRGLAAPVVRILNELHEDPQERMDEP